MSASSLTFAKPPLTYSVLLPHSKLPEKSQRGPATENDAGRLYFTTPEAQRQQLPQQTPSFVASAVRDAIEHAEERFCALHRVRVAPMATPLTNVEPQTILYAERANAQQFSFAGGDHDTCEAILTACSRVYEREMPADTCFEAATMAPLCVFQDVCGDDQTREIFWNFLAEVLRHGTREGTSVAAVAGVRCRLVPAFESAGSESYCVDAFAEDVNEGEVGEASARMIAVDSAASAADAVAYLQRALAKVEARYHHGSSLLVVEATWRRRKHLRQQSPSPPAQPDTKVCLVWMPGTVNYGNADGVYADVALEMLLDELTLAASTPRDSSGAAEVLKEAGLQRMFDSCRLTNALRNVLCASFPHVCTGARPLFHWLVCAPPSSTSRLDNRVTRRTFPATSSASAEDVWGAMEVLEHWKDVAAVAATRSATVSLVPVHQVLSPAADRPTTPLSRSTSLRERSRLSRQRRAIRQSGHHSQTASSDGSVLARQRRKMNVQKLYGYENGESPTEAQNGPSLESSLAGSGVFHHTRSDLAASVNDSFLLDAEETLGRSTRRTARLVKRIPKAATVADDEL